MDRPLAKQKLCFIHCGVRYPKSLLRLGWIWCVSEQARSHKNDRWSLSRMPGNLGRLWRRHRRTNLPREYLLCRSAWLRGSIAQRKRPPCKGAALIKLSCEGCFASRSVGNRAGTSDTGDGDRNTLRVVSRIGLGGNRVDRLDVVGRTDKAGYISRGDTVFQEELVSCRRKLAGVIKHRFVL